MHHRLDALLTQEAAQELCVADVALDEAVARMVLQARQVLQVARVGEQVQVHHSIIGMLEQMAHCIGRARGIAPPQPLIGQPAQTLGRGFALCHLGRVFVAQLIKRESQGSGKRGGAVDRCGVRPEKAAHVRLRSQAFFGIRQCIPSQLVDAKPGPDGRQHVGELAPRAVMHLGRAGGDRGNAEAFGARASKRCSSSPSYRGAIRRWLCSGKRRVSRSACDRHPLAPATPACACGGWISSA